MKILIVEDEPSLRELIQRSLEKERYVVEVAGDFISALRKIEDYDYDCVLLDIMLPDGSGLDLLEKLKDMHKRENVIIISAKDSLEDKVLGLELGADDYPLQEGVYFLSEACREDTGLCAGPPRPGLDSGGV